MCTTSFSKSKIGRVRSKDSSYTDEDVIDLIHLVSNSYYKVIKLIKESEERGMIKLSSRLKGTKRVIEYLNHEAIKNF